MDKLESLSSTLANITLYDIKSMYNQVRRRPHKSLAWAVLTLIQSGQECGLERY